MNTTSCEPEGPTVRWDRGWRRYIFPAFWLVYLGQTVAGVQKHSTGAAAAAGYTIVGCFAVGYLLALQRGMDRRPRSFWVLYGLGFALTAVECVFAHQDALAFLVYLSVLTVATRRPVVIVVATLGYATAAIALPPLVTSWHAAADWDLGITLVLVAFALLGFFKIIDANEALAAARAEVARLAAENERSRIARDLHDLLGHSLTTITVKAGLARRLAERGEDDRARAEIAEVEQLSRRTLGDVRAAVSAHRELTLAGELATGREVLRAAGIIAELPASVAEVDQDVEELFGWVVREGLTNVIRHSRATHVRITLGARSLEIADDGRGGVAPAGNGLRGVRERVEALRGRLHVAGRADGFVLRVDVPAPATVPARDLSRAP
ncbi:two-component system, NarL family, sensor histidine kinase DesK [Jatrophihabitans endophyticus]|uniref:Two-component system, NarL family, sensor histidine kinase DesK n=1 Tax=Jatrophihabitans endophyticus TaxID=1206085 RepID=A0A1M5R711_9ACTN|nr:histidine kinase [Jatrophihabitans endophyticus]SHH22144.1 two-component system, NarL family, sensor histidine kinase DesK [Jatrophihabitans endophyticus]